MTDNKEALEQDDLGIGMDEDNHAGMEIGMKCNADGTMECATVKRRMENDEGMPLGTANNDPLMDARTHQVECLDSTLEALSSSTISENILGQSD